MLTKRDVGRSRADQVESSISRLAGRLAIMETDGRERRAIGQLRATVQAPVSSNEAHVAGWERPAVRWSASFGNGRGVCRRWWAGTVARPPSAQVSSVVRSVVRASGRRRSILPVHLSAPLRQSVGAYSKRQRRAGGGGRGRRTYPIPSRGPNRRRQ